MGGVWWGAGGREAGVSDAVNGGGGDGREGGSEDDTDGERDEGAARDEVGESVGHGFSCVSGRREPTSLSAEWTRRGGLEPPRNARLMGARVP